VVHLTYHVHLNFLSIAINDTDYGAGPEPIMGKDLVPAVSLKGKGTSVKIVQSHVNQSIKKLAPPGIISEIH